MVTNQTTSGERMTNSVSPIASGGESARMSRKSQLKKLKKEKNTKEK